MTREERIKLIRHLKYNRSVGADYLITDKDVDEIIKALEKATPKKPYLKQDDFGDGTLSCPTCKAPIVNVWSTKKYNPNYCHYCGQKLDWEAQRKE